MIRAVLDTNVIISSYLVALGAPAAFVVVLDHEAGLE